MKRLTRRRFLGTTSAALGTLSLPTRLAKALNPPAPPSDLTLWYEKPAAQWTDALPIGNGRLGAMVYGGGEDSAPTKSSSIPAATQSDGTHRTQLEAGRTYRLTFS